MSKHKKKMTPEEKIAIVSMITAIINFLQTILNFFTSHK